MNNNDEMIGILTIFFAILLYGIIGIVTGYCVSNIMHKNPGLILGRDRLVSKDALYFLYNNYFFISVMCGSLWFFFIAFIIWVKIGRNIYNTKLKNEEDRFVSWFV